MPSPKPDPNYDLTSSISTRDAAKLETIHQILDATDTDLTRFRSAAASILMYFGWADPALNPMMGVEYYEAVTARMGPGTTDFFRLFMVPGMFHCGDGPGPNQFDTARAPHRLGGAGHRARMPSAPTKSSRRQAGAHPRRSASIPQVAKRTRARGSTDDAANFTCVKP